MTLPSGTTLTHYTILGPLGAGAMGEVFRARDTRLGREVAIKVLPAHLADEPERLQRFEREARSLASLNHPGIAQIYGVDRDQGVYFLALELVPGRTLEEVLSEGPLHPDEALDVARQIAEAMEAAHEAGVIHRDLKPANIRVTPDGKVKLLDFGLARPTRPEEATASTDSVLSTEAGRLLGTPTYMAPEQARGKPIDRRVDVWAFGCVLYECLTGRRAFAGETLSDVIGAVLHSEPDLGALLPGTPPHARRLLARCLEKDPRRRLRDIGEARVLLEQGDEGLALPAAAPRRGPTLEKLALAAILGALATATILNLGRHAQPGEAAPGRVVRFEYAPPPTIQSLSWTGAAGKLAVLTPDDRSLLQVGFGPAGIAIYRRELDRLAVEPVEGTQGGSAPFLSPDGEWVGFVAQGELRKVRLPGGPAVSLARAAPSLARGGFNLFGGASWGDDGTIVYAVPEGLMRVAQEGGEPERLLTASERGVATLCWPHVLPDGSGVLYTEVPDGEDDGSARIVLYSYADGSVHELTAGTSPSVVDGDLLVFGRIGAERASLWTARLDLERRALADDPTPRLGGLEDGSNYDVPYSVSAAGSLLYQLGGGTAPDVALLEVTRAGGVRPLAEPGFYQTPRYAPDGRRLALMMGTSEQDFAVWTFDLETGGRTRLTFEGGNFDPTWTPDGERVAYSTNREGEAHDVWWKRADGSGLEEPLLVGPLDEHVRGWTQDGEQALVQHKQLQGSSQDVDLVALDGGERTQVLAGAADELVASLSPDGRWVAWEELDANGQARVFLRSLDSGGRWQVSPEGGNQPVWGPDGREVFFVSNDLQKLLAAPIDPGPPLVVGAPRVLFERPMALRPGSRGASYDVHPDGQRFVLTGPARDEKVVVVLGWIEELRAGAAPR